MAYLEGTPARSIDDNEAGLLRYWNSGGSFIFDSYTPRFGSKFTKNDILPTDTIVLVGESSQVVAQRATR